MDDAEHLRKRLARIEKAIADQRAFLHRIPDPDTRERGEAHLFRLVEMRDELHAKLGL